ncbi:MAG: 3-phosphoshikimate 1-carboxyvinyltransferase [Oscillospiraceae bacterium]|nr:3-phosphoshikimate 1-carboxyvinyltransferase [Oscillospiraceae bacterium]
MDLKITPRSLKGEVIVPPSKSVAHRMIIAAALADGTSTISNLSGSADILATIGCMKAFGADIELNGDTAVISGIGSVPGSAELDCNESGSTLRFLIPVACALGVNTEFHGGGKLPQRPITPFLEEFPKHGITFDLSKAESGASLPCSVSGKLTSGRFEIDGCISSQFITGLMLALPLLDGDSEIILTSRLESKPYVDITMGVLRDFGCEVTEFSSGYSVKGGSRLKPFSGSVEGDYSQSAFFYVANALGSDIKINGLNENSSQGDKQIAEICRTFSENRAPFEIDCSDIPDLVPILSVLGCFCKGKSRIYNAARLRIKECDRLAAMEDCLNRIGGKVSSTDDSLIIEGVESFNGGEVVCYNDHRIAMSMAVAATRCTSPLIIRGAECVRKSYPDFFEVYRTIGGETVEI